MAVATTSSATAPRMAAAPSAARQIQRECTLCGRVVTNCAAHTGFTAAEGLGLGGVGYAVYVGSTALGVFSGGFFLAAALGQICWARYRNVRALGDAATDIEDAAGVTHAAAIHAEQAALQSAATAGRIVAAAGSVSRAADGLAGAASALRASDVDMRAAEMKATAASVVAVNAGLPLHLNEFRHLLGTTSILSHEIRRSLDEIKKAIRSSSGDVTRIAELETRFETASGQLRDGVAGGVDQLKQILTVMSEAGTLCMQIMRENNERLVTSLGESNTALAATVDRAGTVAARIAEAEADRGTLVARLEQLQRDNTVLQARLSDTVLRLEAETRRWAAAAPTAAATVGGATTALAGERAQLQATLTTLRGCVEEITRIRRASPSTLAGLSRSHSGGVEVGGATTGEAKTGV